MPTDLELWTQFCRGDAEAFNAFYSQHAPRLRTFLVRVVRDSAAAEDIMQETFTQIWRKPNGFQPDRGTLRSYVYGVAHKRAMDWWRSQRPGSPDMPDNAVRCRADLVSQIDDALGHLPEEQRTLLWLREVDGHSYVELAEMLSVPVGTIRSRLFAAREALRAIWRSQAKKEGA